MMFHRSRKKDAASEKPEKVRRRNSDGVIAEFYLALISVLGMFPLYGSFLLNSDGFPDEIKPLFSLMCLLFFLSVFC